MEVNIDDKTVKSAIKFVIDSEEELCRLCITPITKQKVILDEVINIERTYYFSDKLTYNDILHELGVQNEPLLPNLLCENCALTIMNAYLFTHLIEYSKTKWYEIMKRLNNGINTTRTVSESAKTVFVVMRDSENIILTSRTSTKDKEKTSIKLKNLMRYKKRYEELQQTSSAVICEECGEQCKSNTHLAKHNSKVHQQSKFPCPKCPRMLMSQALLEAHMVRMHHPKKFKCPKCDKMFSTENLLLYHDRHYHMSVLCKLCFVQFSSKSELRAHLNKHDALNCPQCEKTFYNKQSYKNHIKICGTAEQGQVRFFCDLCNKAYAHKPALRNHIKVDHGFGVNLHCCKYCGKKFDAPSKLRNHIIKHTKERNFYCVACGNKFVTAKALLNHTRLHTGEKPYQCELCSESFVSTSRRMEHVHRKHLGPQQECPICHSKFILKNQLNKHIKKHSNPHSKLYVPMKIEM